MVFPKTLNLKQKQNLKQINLCNQTSVCQNSVED
jgi:hypothetical protein